MSEQDIGFVVVGAFFVVIGLLLIPLFLRRRKDEIFVGIPAGMVPAPGQQVKTTRVSGSRQHYTGRGWSVPSSTARRTCTT